MSPKTIKRLAEDKKYREEHGLFVVEGEKNIHELLHSDFEVVEIVGTRYFIEATERLVCEYEDRMTSHTVIRSLLKESDLVKIGTFTTNAAGIAIARQKQEPSIEAALENGKKNIVLVLNDIRDPGNFGTIIRIADWYGVSFIIASPTTTDLYNPKTINSSMGSFTRTSICYHDLAETLVHAQRSDLPIIAAIMDGENMHTTSLPINGLLLMGSESHGIHEDLLTYASHKVSIPRFGGAESLNVSVATGILLDTLRRNQT